MTDPITKADCEPCYSPITPDAIRSALIETDAPPDVGPRIAQLLDELQLNLLRENNLVPEGIVEQASDSRYLYIDRHPGEDDIDHSAILFVTGAGVSSYFDSHIPENASDFEREILELASRVYANKSGFNNRFQPPIVPLVVRLADHDELLMNEPGSYQPLPDEETLAQQSLSQ